MKIVWTRQNNGRGDTPENPIVVPISLSLKVEFEDDRPAGAFHQRWNARYIVPHYSEASDFPWRWYGLDGGGHTPSCGVPLLKGSNKGIGTIDVYTWCSHAGKQIRDTRIVRTFYVRNRTDKEKRADKDKRWSYLHKMLGRLVHSVTCLDGRMSIDNVWIMLINEFIGEGLIKRGMWAYHSKSTLDDVDTYVAWVQDFLVKKLENPEYDPNEKEDPTDEEADDNDVEEDVDGDTDTNAGDDNSPDDGPDTRDDDVDKEDFFEILANAISDLKFAKDALDSALKDLETLEDVDR